MTLPQISHYRLSNGLALVHLQTPPGSIQELGFTVRAGPRFENSFNTGVSHFCEHMLFRGTEGWETLELHSRLETLGGPLSAMTSRDTCHYHMVLHPEGLGEALALLGQIVQGPTFADIDVERPIILEERLEGLGDRGEELDAEAQARPLMWPGASLSQSIIGTDRSIKEMSEALLRAHHQSTYVAQNAILSLTGPTPAAQAVAAAETALSSLPSGATLPYRPIGLLGRARLRILDQEGHQDSLLLSHHAPSMASEDYLTTELLYFALADGMTSRLQWNICEKRGLVYDLDATYEAYPDVGAIDILATAARGKLLPLTCV